MESDLAMSVYHQFKKITEVVDCRKFIQTMDNLMVYMKMSVDNAKIDHDDIFDWMALIADGNYKEYEIKDDINGSGDWSDDDLNHIQTQLHKLIDLMNIILNDFEKTTGVRVYFEYNNDAYFAYFDFNANNVFDIVLKLFDLEKTKA
jgi:hypothetical protein